MITRVIRSVTTIMSNRSVAVGLVLALVATTIVIAAVRSDGVEATNVQLDDGAVWVTNQDRNLVGRLNLTIDELDIAVSGARSGIDVLQDGRTVLFAGRDGGVQTIDVVSNAMSGANQIPISRYLIGGGVGVVYDPATGALWTGSASTPVASDYPEKPDALIAIGAHLVVTEAVPETVIEGVNDDRPRANRGRILVVDGSQWYEVALTPELTPVREGADQPEEVTSSLPSTTTTLPGNGSIEAAEPEPVFEMARTSLGIGADELVEVSAVGGELVVLATDNRVVASDGRSVAVPGTRAHLQQVGAEADEVIVATDTGLFSVSLRGEMEVVELVAANGLPSAPVKVGPCAFGAWTGEEPTYVRWCEGGETVAPQPVPRAGPNAELVWRVNQRNVALNSVGDGDVWANHDGTLAWVGNWDQVEPRDIDTEELQEDSGDSRTVTERTCVEGSDAIPISGDDQVGVRPRQSILDVLTNDDDVNCEPIAISSVEPSSGEWGTLTIINSGQHLLYSPSDLARTTAATELYAFQFTYVVSDAAGNRSSPATVTVSVRDHELGNLPPALLPKADNTTREMTAVVEEGQSVTYDVMPDWWDPDGDDLRLAQAQPVGDGEVSSTPDGVVRFSANGVSPGVYEVDITVSDGIDATTEQLRVTVKPIGSSIPPVTSSDFVSMTVGDTVTVSPLANDADPNEDTLSLRPLWNNEEVSGYQTRLVGDEVRITALEAGTYRLRYEASDGLDASEDSIWLEVLTPGETNSAPVAVPDQVKLRPDRVVNVDVLANDVDLDGDLLAVVEAEPVTDGVTGGVVRASIVDRRMVQVEVVPELGQEVPTGPFTINYQITDGFDAQRATADRSADQKVSDELQSRGVITVLIQPPRDDQPPILAPDEAVVRSGDVVAVPVLRNDIDPDSDAIKLVDVDPVRAAQMEAANEGVVWVDERYVYVQGGKPGRYSIQYVVEAGSHRASTELTLVVKPPPDPTTNPNQPPEPPDLAARALRDGTVRVKIPLTGVDPDGDSVVLVDRLGVPQGAPAGNRVELDPENPDTVLYTAGPTSPPVDSFTYVVRDSFGEMSTGTVKVMVLDEGGWPPQAHDDVWRGKPGRVLSIPVVANDSSPHDRRIEIAELPFFDLDGVPSNQPINGDAVRLLDQSDLDSRGRIDVAVRTDGTVLVERYRISDGYNSSDASIRVTPDPDAPNMRPVAQQDLVDITEVRDLELGDPIAVDVLANDFDPDDAESPLVYSVPEFQNGYFEDSVLMVPLTESPQIVLYRITDSDADSTIGIVRVPGAENHPPILSAVGRDSSYRTIEAGSAAPLTILLSDITEDPDGDPEIALTSTEVIVLTELGEVSRLGDGSGFVFTPPPNLTDTTTVSIAFEATDRPRATPDERQSPLCNCLAPLVVDVVIEASSPPRVVAQGAVAVPQLYEPVTYDVTPLVVDDQGDELTYEFDASTFGGLTVTNDGPVLTITSERAGDQLLALGSTIPIRYTVSDGKFEPVTNTVVVTISASNRPEPVTAALGPFNEVVRDEVFTGIPNLIDSAFNPFEENGEALTLVDYGVSEGGELTCSADGACEFFSSSTQIRSFTATYTVMDASNRRAIGTFDLSMKGRPLAPGVPGVESVGDHVVNLSWTPADLQGGQLTAYHVTAVETGETRTFNQPGGAFDGLQNDTEYTFTVSAENEIGIGDESSPSSVGIPDRVPDPPVQMAFTDYGDQTLSLEWSPPPTADDFSAILQYEVQIGGQRITVDGGTTSMVVGSGGSGDPLQNGTDYSFRVRARNSAKTDNGWGQWSSLSASTERPSRYPDPPTSVSGVNSGDGGDPRVTVRWEAPGFDGGRAITRYEVCRVADNACQQVDGATLVATFDQSRGDTVTFQVVAFNSDKNRDNSDPSAVSPAVVAVGNPDPPTITSLTTSNHTIDVSHDSANNSGCSSATWQFSRDGGANWQSSTRFSGLTNGQSYTIVGRTVLGSSCGTPGVTYQSASGAPATATPYGDLVTPDISVGVVNTTATEQTVRWSWDHRRGDDGRPGWTAQLSGDCGSQDVTNQRTGSVDRTFSRGSGNRSCTITVSAPGVSSLSDSASIHIADPPPPPEYNVQSTNIEVCPESDLAEPWNYDEGPPPACGLADPLSWVPPNTSLTVTCQVHVGGTYTWWVRISGGTFSGYYIPKALVSGDMTGIPNC